MDSVTYKGRGSAGSVPIFDFRLALPARFFTCRPVRTNKNRALFSGRRREFGLFTNTKDAVRNI